MNTSQNQMSEEKKEELNSKIESIQQNLNELNDMMLNYKKDDKLQIKTPFGRSVISGFAMSRSVLRGIIKLLELEIKDIKLEIEIGV